MTKKKPATTQEDEHPRDVVLQRRCLPDAAVKLIDSYALPASLTLRNTLVDSLAGFWLMQGAVDSLREPASDLKDLQALSTMLSDVQRQLRAIENSGRISVKIYEKSRANDGVSWIETRDRLYVDLKRAFSLVDQTYQAIKSKTPRKGARSKSHRDRIVSKVVDEVLMRQKPPEKLEVSYEMALQILRACAVPIPEKIDAKGIGKIYREYQQALANERN